MGALHAQRRCSLASARCSPLLPDLFILLKNKDQETAVGLCSHPNCPQLKGSAEDSAHGQLQGVLRQSSCRDDVLELPIACRDPLPKTAGSKIQDLLSPFLRVRISK